MSAASRSSFPSPSNRELVDKHICCFVVSQFEWLTMNFYTVAPATGTPETGGWSTRELRTIIRGLEGVNFIAADIVEVAPAYDTNAELTVSAPF